MLCILMTSQVHILCIRLQRADPCLEAHKDADTRAPTKRAARTRCAPRTLKAATQKHLALGRLGSKW